MPQIAVGSAMRLLWMMARKVRVLFPGAKYHIYNRGNYRLPVFASAGAARAFENCLFEACARYRWRLLAYCIMVTHYHLAIATPEPNLPEGMHWLLSTYATRFNCMRDECGHLFQGRYHAKLVEGGSYLGNLVNYLHLNPVDAGIVPVERVASFRWSSLRRFVHGGRPPSLVCEDWLAEFGSLPDNPAGWRSYLTYLARLAADAGERQRQTDKVLTRSWALGSQEWIKTVALDQAKQRRGQSPRRGEIDDMKAASWTQTLDALLGQAGRSRTEAAEDKLGATWKVDLAVQLRLSTTATNAWIASELHMGSPHSVGVYLSKRRHQN